MAMRRQLQTTVSTVNELTAALSDVSVDRITLAEGHYLLSSQLCIRRNVILAAAVPGKVVLDGQGSTRVLGIIGGVVELTGLNITGGYVRGGNFGAGIWISHATVTISALQIYSNTLHGYGGGGGLWAGENSGSRVD